MNNYSDYRNYYMLNGQNNMNNNNNNHSINPNMNQMQDSMNHNQNNQMNSNVTSSTLPGVFNNPNFNKCDYDQQDVKASDLYDPYQGFIRGNMFPDLYNTYKIRKPYEVEPMNEQARILTYVDQLEFAAHDLNLYLDTHPNNREMIHLFNQYREEANRVIREYENKFGPLLLTNDALNREPWAWNQLPWPWENR